ncbi:MAG: alpha-mannosidase [Fimbriimonadaceae bacterium]|nr:alpha-mannosidase [Fimbriimonadaceae bacterium]
MLKHTTITRDRVRQFIEFQLREGLLHSAVDVPAELLVQACATPADAAAAKGWKPVRPGDVWGPTYQEGWYRVAADVPAELRGQSLVLTYGKPEIAWERGEMVEGTVFAGDVAVGGLDFAHNWFRLPGGATRLDYLVQTYAHNAETTVHRPEKPRTAKPEVFRGFILAALDEELLALYFDCAFCFDFLNAVAEDDPAHATVLRALNDVCNLWAGGRPKSLAGCRKVLRDALDSLGNELKHTITPVGHAHLDTAWLWPLSVTHLKMTHTTALQLDLMDKYPEHVFAHSQASQYEWLEKERPELFDRVKRAVKRGQWEVVGSMWVEADCNLTGPESLVRQFLYGRRYFHKHFGTTTDDLWLPDVFGYSAAIPQILDKFGIQFFLTQKMSWNQTNKIPHNTFWWKGIDGTSVWTHFPPADTYIASGAPSEIVASVKKHRDQSRSDRSLYLYGFGDGGGGPTEFHLERLRRARSAPAMPAIETRTKANHFFHRAKEESKDLCTWSGELYFEMHRGTYTSQAANKRDNRVCEFLLRDAELLAAFAPDYPAAELESAWKLVLLNQFHDIIPGSSVREVYVDSARDYAEVKKTGAAVVERSLRALGQPLVPAGVEEPFAIFHNARVPSQAAVPFAGGPEPNSVVCDGESLPVQVVEAFGERQLVFPVPTGALGAVAVAHFSDAQPLAQPRLKAAPRKLESHEWSVKFDAHGNITSLQTLEDDPVEFVQPGKLANLFQILDDRPLFWDAWDTDAYSQEAPRDLVKSESFEVVEKGPVRVAVELVKRFGDSTVRQRISLGPTPGIRFDTEVDWRESHKMLKVAFPVNVNATRGSFEIQFGHVERPTHRNTSWDTARFEVCAQKWADLSEGGHGMALINTGKYGHDVHDNVMRLSLLRSPKAPDPVCDMGVHRFTYVLLPHYGQVQHSDVVDAAYAVNAEPHVVKLKAGKGGAGTSPELARVDDRNLVVEAVKKAEDSDKLVVRLYEAHNSRGTALLSLARPVRRAWLADLMEKPGEDLEVVDGSVRLTYRPFEIITVLAEV